MTTQVFLLSLAVGGEGLFAFSLRTVCRLVICVSFGNSQNNDTARIKIPLGFTSIIPALEFWSVTLLGILVDWFD
ncbi:MAG TPA: hypothetical protein DCQ47_05155 [Gammaproteobacteria bacterium]|nr:hypothetical protein [Gammaproteobacteria bacterium]